MGQVKLGFGTNRFAFLFLRWIHAFRSRQRVLKDAQSCWQSCNLVLCSGYGSNQKKEIATLLGSVSEARHQSEAGCGDIAIALQMSGPDARTGNEALITEVQ